MRVLNSISYSLLQVFFWFMLFQYITCDCEFPDDEFLDGTIIYQSPSDANKTYAEDLYILQFECNPGFQLIGRRYVQCVDDEWIPDIPFCAVMECSRPPNIGNATFEVKSGVNMFPVVGSYAVYTCNVGYELEDKKNFALRCVFSRKYTRAVWAGKIPICNEIMSCPDPGVSKFGKRIGKCCLSGSSVQYECEEGYALVGEEIIHCLPLGNWTSLRPLCKPPEEHCELPPRISHGIIIGDKEGDYYLPYEEAQVICEPGYKCEGPEFVLCEKGGEWESEFGECKEIFCDLPPPLDHGTILELESSNMTSFPYNFELTYVCDKNYRLIGDSWRICGKRGTWTGKKPTCEVTQCPDPGIPENGIRMADNYTVGSIVRFGCFHGYNLLGSLERHCLKNGQWSGEIARCDLPTNYCPNPGIPIKGWKNSSNYELGSIIGFRCQDGYLQLGSEYRECLMDHTWSGTETKCMGRYDFDSEASIKEKLRDQISKRAKEQQIELDNYRQLKFLQRVQGIPEGKLIDLNYPGRLILYFMFDVSGSVGKHNFDRSIEFAKAIVKKVGISEIGARAGALTFGSTAEGKFLPMHWNTTEAVLKALDDIEYTGGGTATSSAFTLLRRDFIPLVHADENIGKINVKSIIFVITDGKANMGGSPIEEADLLKKAGMDIYCIGITGGGDIRMKTLYDIASKSKNKDGVEYPNVYILENYATLSWLIQEITNGTIDYSQCGLGLESVGKMGAVRERIIGGQESKDPWPWMAALFMRVEQEIPPKYQLNCGGSIIHRNFILTAAHCLFKDLKTNPVMRDKNSIIIKLGLKDQKNETFVQETVIQKVFIHPSYQPGNSFDYDIALLQMERPAEYNAFVRPICLPPKELPDDSILYKPKSSAWATGWGHDARVSRNDIVRMKSTENLKELYLPIQPRDRCVESTRSNEVDLAFFTDRMFCAGDGTGGNDTCQGDSGGPLMQAQTNAEGYLYWTQVGIVSWGIQCGLPNTYGYYTYLQKFVPWIEETLENAIRAMGE